MAVPNWKYGYWAQVDEIQSARLTRKGGQVKNITRPLAMAALICLSFSAGHSGSVNGILHAAKVTNAATPKWMKVETPLRVEQEGTFRLASAEGIWQVTSSGKDKVAGFPTAAKIVCSHSEKTCRESDAIAFLDSMHPELFVYDISRWTEAGIMADDRDTGNCGIGHRLLIDFKNNAVTISGYLTKKATGRRECEELQNYRSSYALRGGHYRLSPSPSLDDELAGE
jgi:hypothetical protein